MTQGQLRVDLACSGKTVLASLDLFGGSFRWYIGGVLEIIADWKTGEVDTVDTKNDEKQK